MAHLFKQITIEYWIHTHHVNAHGIPCAPEAPDA
jgi:hypothetical protein